MGCDDGSGNCFTKDADGRIILFSSGGRMTPKGLGHTYRFREMLQGLYEGSVKESNGADVVPICHARLKKYPK